MKVLKYVLLAVGGVVVLVAAAIAVVFATFDPNKYKSELSRVVKEKTGRTLDIAGVEVRASSATWRDEATGNRYKATIDELKTGRIASGVPGKLSLAARVEASQPKANYQVSLSGQYRLNFERQAFALSGMEL